MRCRKCGAEIPDSSVYCNACGTKQEGSASIKKRGNGQGCVYRRGSGWAAEITKGYYLDNGKMKRKIARKQGFKTKKEAVLYLETLRNQKETPKAITFSALWETYLQTQEVGKSKRTAYNIAWSKISDVIGWQTIDRPSVPELQELVDEAAPSYYTRKDIKTVLSKLYQIAIRDDYIDKNKAQFIKLPKLEAAERSVLTEEQIQALWQDYNDTSDRISGEMLLMIYTGIRPGELLQLKAENVNLADQYMTGGIKTQKSKNRKIILPDKILPVISAMVSGAKRGRIAYYNKAEFFYNAWISKRSVLGFPDDITPYCCRHTYITRLTALGVSPAMLQELAGHEDYDTTLIYTHLSVQDRLSEVNKLA